jgi:ABC-type transporter Mla maintaining outer membrane lipid asymmetry ATPase subunit MlaF
VNYHFSSLDGEPRDRLKALLTLTGLDTWADRYPAEVNRNWQQRIGLARALALKPEVLLLDSPLAGLDPIDAEWWLDMISGLAAGHPILDGRPATVVVTGDDLRPWRDRAGRFAVLRNRELIVVGERDGLRHHPESILRDLLLQKGRLPNVQRPSDSTSSREEN